MKLKLMSIEIYSSYKNRTSQLDISCIVYCHITEVILVAIDKKKQNKKKWGDQQ
jgi:hypothetical protein